MINLNLKYWNRVREPQSEGIKFISRLVPLETNDGELADLANFLLVAKQNNRASDDGRNKQLNDFDDSVEAYRISLNNRHGELFADGLIVFEAEKMKSQIIDSIDRGVAF